MAETCERCPHEKSGLGLRPTMTAPTSARWTRLGQSELQVTRQVGLEPGALELDLNGSLVLVEGTWEISNLQTTNPSPN